MEQQSYNRSLLNNFTQVITCRTIHSNNTFPQVVKLKTAVGRVPDSK